MEETYLDFFNRCRGAYLHTDKSSCHSYIADYYNDIFTSLRDVPLNILEIGNYRGDFLRLCRDYFTANCNIIGIDLYPYDGGLIAEGITFIKADAYTQETLDIFPNEYFDICIDDGSHHPEH